MVIERLAHNADLIVGDVEKAFVNGAMKKSRVKTLFKNNGLDEADLTKPALIFYEKIKDKIPNNEAKIKGNDIVILDNKKNEVVDLCERTCNQQGKKAEITFKDELIKSFNSVKTSRGSLPFSFKNSSVMPCTANDSPTGILFFK